MVPRDRKQKKLPRTARGRSRTGREKTEPQAPTVTIKPWRSATTPRRQIRMRPRGFRTEVTPSPLQVRNTTVVPGINNATMILGTGYHLLYEPSTIVVKGSPPRPL